MALPTWILNYPQRKEKFKISKYLRVVWVLLRKEMNETKENSYYFDTYMKQTISFAKSKVLKDKINDLNVRISKMDSNTNTMINIAEKIKKIHLPDKKSRTPSGKGINAVRFLR